MPSKRDIILVVVSVLLSLGIMWWFQPSSRSVSISSDNSWSRFVSAGLPVGANTNFIYAAKIAVPAVVRITVRNKTLPIWDYGSIVSSGSGVLITADGYIVTNHHVIASGNKYEVMLDDGKKYDATVIGSDESSDIAVLKIDRDHCPYLTFGNSDSVKVGQGVIAIGNPFRLNSTVTSGIVSGKSRTIDLLQGDYPLESFIQTDAVFNEGNSGGALVDEHGELIGINTAIYTRTGEFEGYSFAIPSNIVRKMSRDIITYGKVQRAFLGIGIEDITDRISKRTGEEPGSGVYVNRVNPNTSAADAGLQRGDIILSINGIPVRSYPALQEQIALYQPGDKVNINFRRGQNNLNIVVELMSPIASDKKVIIRSDTPLKDLGIELRYNTDRPDAGIIVQSVMKGSYADRAGLKQGFIIREVNGVAVENIDMLLSELSKNQNKVLFRGNNPGSRKTVAYSIIKSAVGF
ncbi:MAG: trypsin-like peptidase domain-containing protein [Saprospiraceae bacterium]|nr:trypsin-like peptidase domain-containing protein [Saprospiraceae bacterium]